MEGKGDIYELVGSNPYQFFSTLRLERTVAKRAKPALEETSHQ